jgi:hypothetical protein
MGLPPMKYTDRKNKPVQIAFGGYNHTEGAKDGEIRDMTNLCADDTPVLSTRPRRYLLTTLTKPNGIFGRDKLCWVDGTSFYYDGILKGTVADSKKTFAAMGPHIVIFPDKKYYNTVTGAYGSMEATWSGTELSFQDGLLFGESAKRNTIYKAGVLWENYFKAGDAIKITGCTVYDNNQTTINREIAGDKMYFYEYVFIVDDDETVTSYTEPGAVTLSRTVPDMDFILENENRLWGCKGDTIYASKLGDIFNFNVFDGLSTDSYAIADGAAGDFTAALSFLGYPVNFKERKIVKVYGSLPSNFQPMGAASLGVAAGSSKSPAVAGEILYYLSGSGIAAYNGGIPSIISGALGTMRFKNAVGGSDGLKYFVSMQDEASAWHLFVFDTQRGLWHREDALQAVGFAYTDNLYVLRSDGKIQIIGRPANVPEGATLESAFAWSAEFADFSYGTLNRKYISRLQIQLELEAGATAAADVQYDSSGTWQTLPVITASAKNSVSIPVVPRRCDHFKLKLSGTGGCKIYGMAIEYAMSSEF